MLNPDPESESEDSEPEDPDDPVIPSPEMEDVKGELIVSTVCETICWTLLAQKTK